ncbi:hypothetical protein GCM10010873_08780 [Cypionkella aquatica]|uniref:Uncharacterized protein n=1 Tax=Cypionkella aquatica TaxID=1756042 RepID=A0AA37TQ83_9RHOB|nr:hypothetical protein [Cypionkella aquatica]GLS85904.1 hypothetical protein GCM10010873_08780 [Cypionkella aquatica]
MPNTTTPIETFLAPLSKLALKHPEVEAEVIWAADAEWEPQQGTDALLEAEEIPFYAEGLLLEGFQMHYQILADTDAAKLPAHVRLFFWQADPPALPTPEPGLILLAGATWTA